MILSQRTADMLEWRSFLNLYATFVDSEPARKNAQLMKPSPELQHDLNLTREALLCVQKGQAPSFASMEDISLILQKAAIENHVLEGMELYHTMRLASLNNDVGSRLKGWKQEYPLLHEKGMRLPDLRNIEKEIASKIEPDGQVKEDATPELARIRKQILHLKSRVEHALERYLRDKRYAGSIQEDYVTYRHGRAVLVVRSEQKNAIRGVIHGESGSGASVYMEPLNVLEPNNDLAQLEDRQRQEIHRLLRELTGIVRRESDLLQFALQQLIEMDLVLARGRFGKGFDCVVPEISQQFAIRLINARHPLLQNALRFHNRPVVPLSFELPADKKVLVVTGPNTGGKTVFLKTAGLLLLMAHFGIPIPAEEGSTIPELSKIDADIGDQQSISESLSTFSSHMINIVGILSKVQSCSLVLLDELGTGTDPEEGAPLGVSIVQELLKHEVKAIVTSHHSQMKVFAWNHPECVTAAMEFDPQTLTPTYRVLLDQIGASHAFEIAERLGLPPAVLQRARDLTGENQRQLQEFQERLQERIRELERRQEELSRERREWEQKYHEQEQHLQSMEQNLQQRMSELHEKNTDLIRTLNARVETLLANIQDATLRQEMRKQYQQSVAPAMQQVDDLTAQAEQKTEESELRPGDRVWVTLYKEYGEVVGVKKGQAELIIRNKRFTVPLSMVVKKETFVESLPKGIQIQMEQKEVERELNLIGQTVEEALPMVDKYLDDAFLGQLPEVRLIHGHGTGRLRRAIEEMLNGHPHVLRFHPESQQRGGSGVTVVELKTL
jgi:DNA mismatch repair protein MutS2